MGIETIAVGVAAAVGVLILFMGLSGGHNASARLGTYIAKDQPETTSEGRSSLGQRISTSGALTSINRVVDGRDWGANMARELARADLVLKPTEFLAIRVGAIVGIPLVIIALFDNPLLWVVGVGVGFWLPRFWLNRRKGKRLKAFNDNLADTITLLANALRAGSSFLQSIEMVVRETQPPISTEFGRVIREVNLGLPLDQALANMTRRVKSED